MTLQNYFCTETVWLRRAQANSRVTAWVEFPRFPCSPAFNFPAPGQIVYHSLGMTVSSIQQALEQAERFRQGGQWQEADRLCREVLAQIPDHGEAWHLLGIVAFQSGQYVLAVAAMRKAVAAHPDRAHFHCNLGLSLAATGQLDAAVECYRHALGLGSGQIDVYNNLGIALRAQGKFDEAIGAYRQALGIRADSPEVWNNLGNAQGAQGDWKSAAESFARALALRSDYFEAHNNLGFALQAQGHFDEALVSFRRALTLRADSPITLCNLGNALLAKSQTEEGIAAYRKAINARPDMPEPYASLARALLAKDDLEGAMAVCRQALALRPEFAEAFNLLGMALLARQEYDEAEGAFRRALAQHPGFVEAQNNLGNVLHMRGDLNGALAAHRRALEMKPDLAVGHWSIALILLLQGDFQNGWVEFEWRKRVADFRPAISRFARPTWDGSEIAGRRILLHCEQAFGDSIHFARYIPLVARRAGKTVVYCPAVLRRLFLSLEPRVELIGPEDALPEFDVHCPLPSLPMAMRLVRPEDVPWNGSYLKSDPEIRGKFADLIERGRGKLKVGLIWAGRAKPVGRSVPLGMLGALANPGVQFYSLQVGEGAEEAKRPPEGMELIDAPGRIADFADSAALMDQMDLIISIDTAGAQLAGALGKPVWTLLKRVPDWRWLLEREDSPWYPTMRLFRQETIGQWREPIERMALALKGLI